MNRTYKEQIYENINEIYKNNNLDIKLMDLKNKKENEPIFSPYTFHNEEIPNKESLNLGYIEILHDLLLIGNEIKYSALDYDKLVNSTRMDLLEIEKNLYKALEYKKDVNLYKTTNIVNLDDTNCYGNFTYIENCFLANSTEVNENKIEITNIYGNGYEGNKYVLDYQEHMENLSVDTSNRNNLLTDDYRKPYEYSRINIKDINEEKVNNNFNYGTTEAKCIIDLSLEKPSNLVLLTVYGEPVRLTKIEYSNDGLTFSDSMVEEEIIRMNSLIHFPRSTYLKLHLESTKETLEIVGSYKNEKYNNSNFNKNTIEDNDVLIQKSGKRHRISLSSIKSNAFNYSNHSVFKSQEIVDTNETIDSIAIYAEELIESTYKDKNYPIKYSLVINGKVQDITPINLNREGVKIIKTTKRTYDEERSIFIDEEIKSAYLIVEIATNNELESPAIKNLKILKY